jgi:drug/metabolite transporter (DMT)-like permease
VKPQTRRWVVGLLAATLVLAWSFNYIAGKVALRHLDPLTLASFRLVLAGTIYLAIFLLAPRPVRLGWRDVPTFIVLGLCGVAINQGGFTISLDFTSIGHVAMIVAVGPVLVLLVAALAGQEKLTPVKIAGMVLSFAGVAMLAIQQGFRAHAGGLAGDLIALGAVTGFAFFVVLGKRVAHRYDTIAFGTFIHFTGAILMFPLAVHQALHLDWGRVGWAGWAGLGYMAFFASVIGYLVFHKLLGYLTASSIASLNYLLPVVATTLGVLLLGEHIGRSFIAAAALVLGGVWLAQRARWHEAPAD